MLTMMTKYTIAYTTFCDFNLPWLTAFYLSGTLQQTPVLASAMSTPVLLNAIFTKALARHQTRRNIITGVISAAAVPTLLLEVRVAVSPGSRGGQVNGAGWGEVLSLVQAPLLIGSEVAGRAQHRAGCNACQLSTQKVGLGAWEWWVCRHLQTVRSGSLTDQTWTRLLPALWAMMAKAPSTKQLVF